MKVYGYTSENSEIITLEEVTFKLTTSELKDLIMFMENTLSSMEKYDNFTHEHFKDYIKVTDKNMPDFIISK